MCVCMCVYMCVCLYIKHNKKQIKNILYQGKYTDQAYATVEQMSLLPNTFLITVNPS